MTAHAASPAEIAHEERRYIQVFVWLAVLTALEIGVIYLPLSQARHRRRCSSCSPARKAALVALYYMHLAHEKRTLTYIALTPAILCVFLVFMLLPDLGAITRLLTPRRSRTAAAPQPHH